MNEKRDGKSLSKTTNPGKVKHVKRKARITESCEQQMNDSKRPKEVDKNNKAKVKRQKRQVHKTAKIHKSQENKTEINVRKSNCVKNEEIESKCFPSTSAVTQKGVKRLHRRSTVSPSSPQVVKKQKFQNVINKLKSDNINEPRSKREQCKISAGNKLHHVARTMKVENLSKKEERNERLQTVDKNKSKCHMSSGSKKDAICKNTVKKSQPHKKESPLSIPHMSFHADVEDSDSESESEWEEVEDLPSEPVPEKSQLPDGPVEITLDAPNFMKKKQKKFDMQAWYRRHFNRYQKEVQLQLHKVHILCLLCHGFHRNQVCNSEILQSVAMSMVPPAYFKQNINVYKKDGLSRLTRWFATNVIIAAELVENNNNLEETLLQRFSFHRAASEVELVMMYVILLRALGADVRFVYSLQPLSHKPTSTFKGNLQKKETTHEDGKLKVGYKSEDKVPPQQFRKNSVEKGERNRKTIEKDCVGTSENDSYKSDKLGSLEKHGTAQRSFSLRTKNNQPRKCASKIRTSDNDTDDPDYIVLSDSESNTTEPEIVLSAKKRKNKPTARKTLKKPSKRISRDVEELSSDDFDNAVTKYRKAPSDSIKKKNNRNVVSDDSDDSIRVLKEKIKGQGSDFWLEVFLEDKWICVDCIRCRLDLPEEMECHATQPVSYVMAYDNNNCVKDVTQRYASSWMKNTRKLRVDKEWWTDTLHPFRVRDKAREEKEDIQLQAKQLQKPLPTSISEYKGHPLYALRRHLLKFEGIYPETAVPVGFVKGEPVFARECVHELHTRETWMQHARVVRIGEKPYKIVKGRKKKRSFEGNEDPTAELFGQWQTEDYIPPPAVDGKVPRNEYGNVELFQPSMLPGGTVYLQLPGLNRIAKKLNIDCAPAMKGWDHHSGFCHPILDGFVVCEEFKDVLFDAWKEDQETQKQKEADKREKRALGNWKLLTKSLLVKERLKKQFSFQAADTLDTSDGIERVKGQRATDAEMSWPRNLMTQKSSNSSEQQELFPFEEL